MPGATTLDRIIVMAVGFLIAAFALGTFSTLLTPAAADDAGKRDDDAVELVAKDDDNDDDDTGNGNGSGDDNSNTRTGTTRGTGPSNTNTRDTKTGTVTKQTRSAAGTNSAGGTN